MKDFEKLSLPLQSEKKQVSLDEKRVASFEKAFRSNSKSIPPTIGIFALGNMFELLNQFEIDWTKLLHISQSFDYHQKLPIPCNLQVQTSLIRYRHRNSQHWLSFESKIKTCEKQELLISAKSSIIIMDPSGE